MFCFFFYLLLGDKRSLVLAFQSRVPVILSHWGSGTSFKNFIHFGQVRSAFASQLSIVSDVSA